jgi:hypothetical protein
MVIQPNPTIMTVKDFLSKPLLTAMIFACLCGCDDEPAIPESPKPDAAALNYWFDKNAEELQQYFTLNASTGGDVKGIQGTVVKFGADAFTTLGGGAITGNVDITLIELYDRASMFLARNLPTEKNRMEVFRH